MKWNRCDDHCKDDNEINIDDNDNYGDDDKNDNDDDGENDMDDNDNDDATYMKYGDHHEKETEMPWSQATGTNLKCSCNETLRSKESDRSANPMPTNAVLPD